MVGRVIRRILAVQELQAEKPELAWQAVRLFEQGRADFADFLIGLSNRENKAEVTYTFDTKAVEERPFPDRKDLNGGHFKAGRSARGSVKRLLFSRPDSISGRQEGIPCFFR